MRKTFNTIVKPEFRKTHTPQCAKCMRFEPWGNAEMVIHHKISLIDGGTNDDDNLIALCASCHEEWHSHFDNGEEDFADWLRKPPLRYYAAIGMAKDKNSKMEIFQYLVNQWRDIKEARMISEPLKNDECIAYFKKYSKDWIDW